MNDPGFRNLALLDTTASTARVLNLRHSAIHHWADPELATRPFFLHPKLNRAIVVKHHLRRNELEAFDHVRTSATKVLLPIDHDNLRAGAKYFFIGQRDYEQVLEAEFALADPDARDLQLLRFLDDVPSFDPFLLREQMRRRGLDPAPCYFNVSQADTARMLSFAQAEIQPLVDIAFSNSLGASGTLARKILSNSGDSALAPLRQVLHLDTEQFAEGVFCWKAFLYYKWRLIHLKPGIDRVSTELATIRPYKRGDNDLHEYVDGARTNLQRATAAGIRSVSHTLCLYDIAYNGLIKQGDGWGFRDFLLQAPARFSKLGEELAAVDHMVSFWQYRFPAARTFTVSVDELATIFRDFESGLRVQPVAQRDLTFRAAYTSGG
ncbi:hypothetical protein [Caulobacter sp. S45]|uniref:hypothetical protein n=1 Tax=Caulobacter sp. S45 TaxID=1641861 RepID=UPI001575116B|nr:hypothetical protein [Caulobacter sp. S45]